MFSLQPKNTLLFPLDILLWARLCSGWNFLGVSGQAEEIHPYRSFSLRMQLLLPDRKKKKKGGKCFSFSGRWSFVSRRIYSSSYLLLRCPFSTQKRGVPWFLERIQVWAMPNLARAPGRFPLVLSGLVLWAVWGHLQLKNNQSFPGVGGGGGGWESATWLLLVSWSTGCL